MGNDDVTKQHNDRDRYNDWRESRQLEEQERLNKWGQALTYVAACVVPLLGLVWGGVLCLRADSRDPTTEQDLHDRLAGLRYLGWALLGCVVYLVLWRLWADELAGFMARPFIEGAEQAARESLGRLR